ncbi:manganese efflux pump MntP family protein [Siminovitchia sediminis]|uniref:Putative manganese efflux pump MntP n=1 Tax=Siminovitchia sediminis TaxID=1274353 RepID=A0ABW4KNQ8_9BACI
MFLPELITLVIMAFAVGMDAFSISLGMGVFKLRLRQIFLIGMTIGFFHMVMPLLGILTGNLLSVTFGIITSYIGGMLLIIMGILMGASCFRQENQSIVVPVGWGLLLFSLIVSLDSFSAGLSLGMFGVKVMAAMGVFGVVSAVLTWTGLLLGRKVQHWLGFYGELLGGSILVLFGIKLILIG